MKISELSGLSQLSSETIRIYRNKKLLRPEQDSQNGYYNYSMEDFLNVLYIRKLRGSNLSLGTISYTYEHDDLTDILAGYQRELERLNREVKEILKRQQVLQITMEHLEEYRENLSGAALIDAYDTRYDYYFDETISDPVMDIWIKNVELFTQTIGIQKELLMQDPLPEKIPISLGLGSYEGILSTHQMPIPENAVVFPKGLYVTTHVILDDLNYIDRAQLQPMMDYIQKHHYTVDSDTTAFLFRIDHSGPRPKRIYRLRVKVVKASEA